MPKHPDFVNTPHPHATGLLGHPPDKAQISMAVFAAGAQVNRARYLESALDSHETETLRQLDATLSRIEVDSDGQCLDWGIKSLAARLHTAPETSRGIPCLGKVESPPAPVRP